MDATIDGLLIVDKPAGLSSARVVGRIKRLLPRGVRVGHAGTLDPFATGVLLVLIGRGTKLCESLMGQPKRYLATIKLGATTPTLDPTSDETITPNANPVDRAAIDAAVPRFVGDVLQHPPAFSALKVGGRSAYKLARAGEVVTLQPRVVHVYSLTVTRYEWPFLEIDIQCGRGTYVRAVARDIGEQLGAGGYLTALRRTRVGDFDVADSVTPAQLTSADDVRARLKTGC